ncbi:hypothetical protein Taro_029806 [Colocasia esculenta]|uniref:Cytochrome P450 89A2 n=1 Tax=Colocasia esculenta TaxID=4460 RepID=A0A843VER5_COLES|nr:hypothetical protein [Colocasia esculenta]
MEVWSLILLSLSLFVPLALLLRRRKRCSESKQVLPPGPPAFPIVGNLIWLRRSFSDIEATLRSLRARYGPLLTIHIGARRAIFVADSSLAHKLLIQKGAVFADRPPPGFATRLVGGSQFSVSSAPYGPLWRVLRRNLTAEILHPSRVKLFQQGRDKVLEILLGKLRRQAGAGEPVVVVEWFQYAMFCLLVFMCFGEMLDEEAVREIEKAERDSLLYSRKLNVFFFFPWIAKFVFRKRLTRIRELRQREKDILIPLIKARRRLTEQGGNNRSENSFQYSYVDSLLDLEIPDDKGGQNRKLTDDDIVSLSSELLIGGTDTTSTTLQWIMANLVKHQGIQARLFDEISTVVGEAGEVREEDLGKLPYLKAVVMEGLRRHPPGHFVLPHAATEDTALDGYLIPRTATSLNFLVTEINWDAKLWKDPMEFRPERFLPGGEGADADITGSREIKMMPFGVGRRICPGLGLAMLHLEYFVANLVRAFEWKPVDGEEVDLTEKLEFTVVMKNPLSARITQRQVTTAG